jgi:hypothetical protein
MGLHIRGGSKTYSNGVQALKDVTLTIPAGMYGLLGPNGSAAVGVRVRAAVLHGSAMAGLRRAPPGAGAGGLSRARAAVRPRAWCDTDEWGSEEA